MSYATDRERILRYNRERQQRIATLTVCVRCNQAPPRPRCETCLDCASRCCDCGIRLHLTGKATGKGARCSICKVKNGTLHSQRRHKHRTALGICTTCAKYPPQPGRLKCEKCLEIGKRYNFDRWRRLRNWIFNHYGNLCVCCGESEPEFLTLDHIANDGAADKRREGIDVYWRIRRTVKQSGQWPVGFQTLCYNCNCSKGKLGVCAHEYRRLRIVNG